MTSEVTEEFEDLTRVMARQFTGATVGLYLDQDDDVIGQKGDHLQNDSTVDDISTEPDADDYERLVLKNGENPTFSVDNFVGSVDHMFFVDDDGELLGAVPFERSVFVNSDMTEVTPLIWEDDADAGEGGDA